MNYHSYAQATGREVMQLVDCGAFGMRVFGKHGEPVWKALKLPAGEALEVDQADYTQQQIDRCVRNARLGDYLRVRAKHGKVYVLKVKEAA